jgi:pimeloyl-ACP methyl ester carboxylesterase
MVPLTSIAQSLVLSLPVLLSQAEPPSYVASEHRCPVALPPGEVEGETVTCGALTVPEDYQNPRGRQIDINYVVLHSRSLSPVSDPVIDLRGGPGGSVIDTNSLELRSRIYEPQRQTRDIVLFDQRGTKFSNRLSCAPFFYGAIVLRQQDPEFAELFEQIEAQLGDAPLTDEETTVLSALCSQGLIAHGVDLNQYNTPNSAQDVVNLAAALDYDQFNLYGISYGTYLAMQVMRDHPTNVRSVVLDSTLPLQVKKYEAVPRYYESSMLHLFEDCAMDDACNAAYPNLKERYIALTNTLLNNPIALSEGEIDIGESSVTLDSLVGLVNFMNQDPRVAPYLPLIVHELEQGITQTYEGVVSGDVFVAAAPTPIASGSPEDYLLRAQDFQLEADRLLRAQAASAQLQRASSQWVQAVQAQIVSLPEEAQPLALANFLGVGYQANQPRDRATLSAFVSDTFESDVAEPLSTALAALPEGEIRHVYEVIADTMDTVYPLETDITHGMFRSVDCREGAAWSDRQQTAATDLSLEIPLLARTLFILAEQTYAICDAWPVDPAPASEHQIVQSDIPTLILGGRYDVQTPIFMGIQAMEGLSQGAFVEFPNTGHGVIAYSQCAQDVGVAFINHPDQSLDTGCTADLQPDFVLPAATVE